MEVMVELCDQKELLVSEAGKRSVEVGSWVIVVGDKKQKFLVM